MPTFRIERTELHTRVWQIVAEDEDAALEQYPEEEDIEEYSYYSGRPDVQIVVISGDD